jgi:hypothetical protein
VILALAFALVGLLAWEAAGYPAAFFFYGAISFVGMAAAYAGFGRHIVGKRADGRLTLLTWLLLAPYLLLNALAFWLYRRGSKKPAHVQVAANLYFGRRLIPHEAVAMEWVGVLDLAAEFSEVAPLRRVARYRSLPILDATAPSAEQLQDAVAWLREVMALGPVYVHCALGHGRSTTVVLAYLLATGLTGSVKEGLRHLRSLRPGIRLHPPQARLLQQYARGI